METVTCNPSQLADVLKVAYAARRSLWITSPPGIGKTAIVNQFGEWMRANGHPDFRIITRRAAETDPVDITGVPAIVDGRTSWCPPDWMPRDGCGGFFADELNRAPQSTQNGFFRIAEQGQLPPGWMFITAGNSAADGCTVTKPERALDNRFIHVTLAPCALSWRRWALAADIRGEVIAFVDLDPRAIYTLDPRSASRAYSTPRTLHAVSDILNAGATADIESLMIIGALGPDIGAQFLGFLKIWRTLPHPDAVLMNPDSAAIPADSATRIALCNALALRASKDNAAAVCKFASRLPAEFSVLLIKTAVGRCAEFQTTRAFIGWASDHSDVLI